MRPPCWPSIWATVNAPNLRKLVRTRDEFGSAGGTLSEFVAKLREDLRRGPREDDATTAPETTAGVRIMTIHQAKGLEFPIVVLPDLNRKPPVSAAETHLHDELGLVVKPLPSREDPDAKAPISLGWSIVTELEKQAEKEEAIRLFYTAVTRAPIISCFRRRLRQIKRSIRRR